MVQTFLLDSNIDVKSIALYFENCGAKNCEDFETFVNLVKYSEPKTIPRISHETAMSSVQRTVWDWISAVNNDWYV